MLSNGLVAFSGAFLAQYRGFAFGSVIYYIVIQTVITLGMDANLLKLLSAAIVAIFLAIPYRKRQYTQKHMRKVELYF